MESSATTDVNVAMPTKSAWGGWGKVSGPSSCPLSMVMSEELIEQLMVEENSIVFHDDTCDADLCAALSAPPLAQLRDDDTDRDRLLALKLQMDYDADYARQVQHYLNPTVHDESHKWKVVFNEKDSVIPADSDEYDSEQEDDEPVKDRTPAFNGRGTAGKGKNIVTKHDAGICSRKNAKKVMEKFPAGIETGDDHSLDMRLPNTVYNQLKAHSNLETKRAQRLHDKREHSTTEQAVDSTTRLIMYKLVNSDVLKGINGVIASGKESVVFHAFGGSLPNEMVPRECALKVFKTTLAEFKNRCQYVRGDARFFKDEFKKQNPRRIMKIWAEKEAMNLRRMARFGIPCPTSVVLKKHVLVMSFIGDNQIAAPTLKQAELSCADLQTAFEQCVQHMKTMYTSCLLVHADLSEYNILWHENKVYFIDVAQAVDSLHPHAMQFLLRDCENISNFFTKRGVVGVPDAHALFNDITELSLKGDGLEFLAPIGRYEKDERTLQLGKTRTDYPFDYFLKNATMEREAALRVDGGGGAGAGGAGEEDVDSDTESEDSDVEQSEDEQRERRFQGENKDVVGRAAEHLVVQ